MKLEFNDETLFIKTFLSGHVNQTIITYYNNIFHDMFLNIDIHISCSKNIAFENIIVCVKYDTIDQGWQIHGTHA